MTAVSAEAIEQLAGKFARWAEHQSAAAFAFWRPRVRDELVQDRQSKGGGFSGAGLGDADHVATRHGDRDRLQLDWSGNCVVFVCDRTDDRFVKAEAFEGGQLISFLFTR